MKSSSVFALGNFDGVHRGHQAVIKATVDMADGLDASPCVLTFEPHPRSVFRPDLPPFRLTPRPVKERRLKELGIRDVFIEPFSLDFARWSAKDFVDKLLIEKYRARHIIAGFDFVFGHNREGNMQNLKEWLAPHNIGVTEITPVADEEGQTFSSSRTRQALKEGDCATAQHILGRPFQISGEVIQGQQRGRTIGVPTANMALGDYCRPKFGVYAIAARRTGSNESWAGVANLGRRPTVNGENDNLESHLFDFSGDIYGESWEVDLKTFIRPERRFDHLDALREQIADDIHKSRALLERP